MCRWQNPRKKRKRVGAGGNRASLWEQEWAFPLAFIYRVGLQSPQPVVVSDESLLILSQERSRDLKQRLGRPAFRQEARGDLEVSKLFVHPAPSLLCAPTPARGWPIGLPIEWQRHIKQTVLTDVWLHNCNRHFRHTSGSLLSIFF